jgi:Family of unknown function (DUF6788)
MVRSRAGLLRRLTHLAAIAVPGTLVEVFLRCGTASCGCHRDPARRHGPHLYLKFRDPEGRATSLYVPRAQAAAARRAVQAWHVLWDTSVVVGHLNRQALRTRWRRKPGAAAGR